MPACPCFSDMDPYNVKCTGGHIGVSLNGGVAILSQFAETFCGDDAIELESDTFDSCAGHAERTGIYHYHASPSCLLDQIGDYELTNSHSPQIGFAFDGFPIYGPHGNNGDAIYPCTHASANSSDCLDECNGHQQHEIDGFKYHYHITGPIGDLTTSPLSPVPDKTMAPYTIGCFKGVVFDWVHFKGSDPGASCLSDGYTAKYVPVATAGITAHYIPNGRTSSPTNDPSSISPTFSTTSTPTDATTSTPTEASTNAPTSLRSSSPSTAGSERPSASPTISSLTDEPTTNVGDPGTSGSKSMYNAWE